MPAVDPSSSSAPAATTGWMRRVAQRVIRLPRFSRFLIAIFFAVSVTLLLTPIVDIVYTTHFFSWDTRILPALVSTGAGVLMYAIGWWLVVGFAGEQPRPRPAIAIYLAVGCFAVLGNLFLIIDGALNVARG